MLDILTNIDCNTVFSGLSVIFGGILICMFKVISKKTDNTLDDKVVAMLEEWYKKQKDEATKVKKK